MEAAGLRAADISPLPGLDDAWLSRNLEPAAALAAWRGAIAVGLDSSAVD